MTRLAIIGGSGFARMSALRILRREIQDTPYGRASAPLSFGTLSEREVVFLPRHGAAHTIPPHQVNYRANIWALRQAGVDRVLGLAAVGGIRHDMAPGALAVPNQIIDYTYGRKHTFFDEDPNGDKYLDRGVGREIGADADQPNVAVTHIDFTDPYCETLRMELLEAAASLGQSIAPDGTYGATQGPRLETAMEVRRLERDGCDVVGMTGMPEAALARELGLCYACCAFVLNWAAGKGNGANLAHEIEANLQQGIEKVRRLLIHFAHSA